MRILLVCDGKFPGYGGSELQVRVLGKAFLAAGHDVNVVSLLVNPQSVGEFDNVDGIPVQRIVYPKIKKISSLIACVKYGLFLLKNAKKYDAIHVHMVGKLAVVTGILKPFLKAKLAAKISGAWEFHNGILDPTIQKKLSIRFMNYFIKRFDYMQSISNYTQTMLLKAHYDKNKIFAIPNAVEISRFEKQAINIEKTEVKIVFAGRLQKVKALDTLINAIKIIISNNSNKYDIKLLIAGRGALQPVLQNQINKLELNNHIKLLGLVKNIPKFFSEADIYIQPSLQEGMPNSVIEAMATGLPIVATNISGSQDLVTNNENGFLVTAGNSNEIAKALLKLINNHELRANMGVKSRKIVEQEYQVSVIISQLINIYK
jgi:glycosyltransferase involved in cell wall biosynthesis